MRGQPTAGRARPRIACLSSSRLASQTWSQTGDLLTIPSVECQCGRDPHPGNGDAEEDGDAADGGWLGGENRDAHWLGGVY